MIRFGKLLRTSSLADIFHRFFGNNLLAIPASFVQHHLPETCHIPQAERESTAGGRHPLCIHLVVSRLLYTEPAPDLLREQRGCRFSRSACNNPAERI